MVQTSLNLGMLSTQTDGLQLTYLIRSSIASQYKIFAFLLIETVAIAIPVLTSLDDGGFSMIIYKLPMNLAR